MAQTLKQGSLYDRDVYIELSSEAAKLIRLELERGTYSNVSELVNDAIHQFLDAKNDANNDPRSTKAVLPESLIGVFDSAKESCSDSRRDPLTELIADKLERQGITIPWRR